MSRTIFKVIRTTAPEFVCKCGTTYRGYTKEEIEGNCEYCKRKEQIDERNKHEEKLKKRIGLRTLDTCASCVHSDWQDSLTCYIGDDIEIFVSESETCKEWTPI